MYTFSERSNGYTPLRSIYTATDTGKVRKEKSPKLRSDMTRTGLVPTSAHRVSSERRALTDLSARIVPRVGGCINWPLSVHILRVSNSERAFILRLMRRYSERSMPDVIVDNVKIFYTLVVWFWRMKSQATLPPSPDRWSIPNSTKKRRN